jgi:predicted Zn-dependent protease
MKIITNREYEELQREINESLVAQWKVENEADELRRQVAKLTDRLQFITLQIGLKYGLDVLDVPEKVIPARIIPARLEIKKVQR